MRIYMTQHRQNVGLHPKEEYLMNAGRAKSNYDYSAPSSSYCYSDSLWVALYYWTFGKKKKNTSCVRCGGLLNLLEDFVKIASESVATFTVAVLICMMPETGPHPIAYSYLAFHWLGRKPVSIFFKKNFRHLHKVPNPSSCRPWVTTIT